MINDLLKRTLICFFSDLRESNVVLKLTTIETAGFGDQADKSESFLPIVNYIDAQFEAYLREETKMPRQLHLYQDTRVHVCLYLISPSGHSLTPLDIVTMKALQSKVNIIPVIAKADTLGPKEIRRFKAVIREELLENGIEIYQFPEDDEAVAELNRSMSAQLPFTVIGSTERVQVGQKMVRGREYLWGKVEVENERHCDFVKLREMMLSTNMEDLRETTHDDYYEAYRRRRLTEMGMESNDDADKEDVVEIYQRLYDNHCEEMKNDEEQLRQAYLERVTKKDDELKALKEQAQERYELMMKELELEEKKLEDRRAALNLEMFEYTERNRHKVEDKKKRWQKKK